MIKRKAAALIATPIIIISMSDWTSGKLREVDPVDRLRGFQACLRCLRPLENQLVLKQLHGEILASVFSPARAPKAKRGQALHHGRLGTFRAIDYICLIWQRMLQQRRVSGLGLVREGRSMWANKSNGKYFAHCGCQQL